MRETDIPVLPSFAYCMITPYRRSMLFCPNSGAAARVSSQEAECLSRSFLTRALSVVGLIPSNSAAAPRSIPDQAQRLANALTEAKIAHQVKPLTGARAQLAPSDYFDLAIGRTTNR